MKKYSVHFYAIIAFSCCMIVPGCRSSNEDIRTFYNVRLNSATNPAIAWASRVKPFLLETEMQQDINESWINRPGTFIAIVWKEGITHEKKINVLDPLFKKFDIEASYVSDPKLKERITESFVSNIAPTQKGKDKWYKGMDVDQLSKEESKSVADTATLFALKAGLINEAETIKIRNEIEEYMKTELVKMRSYKDLISDETDLKWKKYGYEIYIKHIGSERAEKVRDYYIEYQKTLIKNEPCCEGEKIVIESKITCPHCGNKKTETMPTDVCLLKYTCEKCKNDILAKQGDCCVFCSYGNQPCPTKKKK